MRTGETRAATHYRLREIRTETSTVEPKESSRGSENGASAQSAKLLSFSEITSLDPIPRRTGVFHSPVARLLAG